MKKIHYQLEQEIKSHPDDRFNVLITTRSGFDPDDLELDNYKVLMSNIIVSKIDAKKITELSKNQDVLSIEKDTEMEVL